jgi:hydrogenase maturation protease
MSRTTSQHRQDAAAQGHPGGHGDQMSTLVLGVGNYLMGDEGVGVHLAEAMAQEALPEGVEVLDGGTGGFHLMEHMERHPCLIIVDATLDGQPVGTIQRRRPRFAADFPRVLSTHDIGLRDVLEGLSITGKMPDVHLYTISIEDLREMDIALSPAVAEAMHQVKKEILELLRAGSADAR